MRLRLPCYGQRYATPSTRSVEVSNAVFPPNPMVWLRNEASASRMSTCPCASRGALMLPTALQLATSAGFCVILTLSAPGASVTHAVRRANTEAVGNSRQICIIHSRMALIVAPTVNYLAATRRTAFHVTTLNVSLAYPGCNRKTGCTCMNCSTDPSGRSSCVTASASRQTP